MKKDKAWNIFFLLLGLFLLTIPFYKIIYFSDRVLLFRDLSRDLLVQKTIWVNSVRSGNGIPLWNHFALGGTPFIAMNVGSPLNPLNGIFLLFTPLEMARALAFYLFSHYMILFLGAYFLLRKFSLSSFLASMAATSLALSGYMLSVHSLGHILASTVCVPWFFFFLANYQNSKKRLWLWLMSFAIAWPIYAGDPQFTYILCIISLVYFLFLSKEKKRIYTLCALYAGSIFCAAAQLLPTVAGLLESDRTKMNPEEIELFSFHPIRLIETIFPIFFGNRAGAEKFWGEEFVNFPYKTPFVFSTYPCILILFGIALYLLQKNRTKAPSAEKIIFLSIPFGFLLSFGVFLPISIYGIAAKIIPLFSLFRYPERFLFWPLFSLWFISAITLGKFFNGPSNFINKRIRIGLVISAFIALALIIVIELRWWEIPTSAIKGILSTLVFISLLYGSIELSLRFLKLRKLPQISFFLVLLLDLAFNQTKLVWDQSKYMTDINRYKLAKSLKEDLSKRSDEIKRGASFRFSSEQLSFYTFTASQMPHTISSTFSSFENIIPNIPGFFGIEDISGYFSFSSKQKADFQRAAVTVHSDYLDVRFYHDLMGAYYTPTRDEDQQLQMKKNHSAQPYLFSPERIFFNTDSADPLKQLKDPEFRVFKDVIVSDTPRSETFFSQQFEAGNFLIQKRDGHKIDFDYFPSSDAQIKYITVNESFHKNWRAFADGKPVEILMNNAWSMALALKDIQRNKKVRVEITYTDHLFTLGSILSSLWLLSLGIIIYADRKKSSAR